MSPIPAYSGKPANNLVGFDLEGKLRGVTVIAHQEPILVGGISEQDLADYTGQYAGLPVANDIRIGGSPAPGRTVIDGISGATITAMVVNRSISQGGQEGRRNPQTKLHRNPGFSLNDPFGVGLKYQKTFSWCGMVYFHSTRRRT